MFFEAPTRSQFKNKADFDAAQAEYTARKRRCNELSSNAFAAREADYARTITRSSKFS